MKKETQKEKWQRYCKENNVPFQKNDTIAMLARSLAPLVGVDVEKVHKSKLTSAVEKAILNLAKKETGKTKPESVKKEVKTKGNVDKKEVKTEEPKIEVLKEEEVLPTEKKEEKIESKEVDKKPEETIDNIAAAKKGVESKKSPTKKVATKKADKKPATKKIKVKLQDGLSKKESVNFPDFQNVREMKDFCVSVGLHKVDGYILKSKKKKTVFLEWMIDNKDKAVIPEKTKETAQVNPPNDIVEPQSTGSSSEENTYGGGNQQMEDDGNSVIHHLNASFQARFHGGMPVAEFMVFVEKSVSHYTYALKDDVNGKYLELNDGNGNTSRFPKNEALKVR